MALSPALKGPGHWRFWRRTWALAFPAPVRKNALFTDDLLLNAPPVRESARFTDKLCESPKQPNPMDQKGSSGRLKHRADRYLKIKHLRNFRGYFFLTREHSGEHRKVFLKTKRTRFIHHAKHILKQNVAKMVISIQPFQQHSTHH